LVKLGTLRRASSIGIG